MYSTTRESWHFASDCCSRKYSSSSPSPPLLFCQTQSGWDSGPAPRTSSTRPSQCCTPARIRDSRGDSCLEGLFSYRTRLSPSSGSGVTHVEGFSSPHIPNPNPPMPWGASYQAVHLGKFSVQMILGENKWRWINLPCQWRDNIQTRHIPLPMISQLHGTWYQDHDIRSWYLDRHNNHVVHNDSE